MKKFLNTRNGKVVELVIFEDDAATILQGDGKHKTLTGATWKRWYKEIPESESEITPEPESIPEPEITPEPEIVPEKKEKKISEKKEKPIKEKKEEIQKEHHSDEILEYLKKLASEAGTEYVETETKNFRNFKLNGNQYLPITITKNGVDLWIKPEIYKGINLPYKLINHHNFKGRVHITNLSEESIRLIELVHATNLAWLKEKQSEKIQREADKLMKKVAGRIKKND